MNEPGLKYAGLCLFLLAAGCATRPFQPPTAPETPAQAQVLLEAGIPMAQGFLYSRPLPARALQAFQAWHETRAAERGRPPGP